MLVVKFGGNNNPMSMKPRALIVGAGIGGLSLAHFLLAKQIPVRIFEQCARIDPALGAGFGLTGGLALLEQLPEPLPTRVHSLMSPLEGLGYAELKADGKGVVEKNSARGIFP